MRDPEAYERPEPAWCPECQRMVTPKAIDFGIGPWEMGSQRGWHHDWATGCPDCETTKLEESQPETECRRCGEIAPCSGPGVCDPCLAHLRSACPEARL